MTDRIEKMDPIKGPSQQLKTDTIWHTGRDEQPLDAYDERFPHKKRRVSCGGIEIVKCNICGSHFDSPAQLSDHLIRHDADYRFNPIYKCSYGQCMLRTDDRSLMKHHISRVHLKSDQALISRKYRNRKVLKPIILCSTCPMVFATEAELWQHTPTCKDYRCQFCGQHFWTIEKRYSHELAYHEDEFEFEDEEEEDQPDEEEFQQNENDVIGDSDAVVTRDRSDVTRGRDDVTVPVRSSRDSSSSSVGDEHVSRSHANPISSEIAPGARPNTNSPLLNIPSSSSSHTANPTAHSHIPEVSPSDRPFECEGFPELRSNDNSLEESDSCSYLKTG